MSSSCLLAIAASACVSGTSAPPAWEAVNPVKPLPLVPLGAELDLAAVPDPPTPARVRLGRWLFYDRWDESAVSEQVKQGHELFFGKAKCRQCHAGNSFSDSKFHNLGVGWDPKTTQFSDEGRFVVTKDPADRGAFKTPALREVTKHPPYMHDGSVATLREVVELYNRGGEKNPYLDVKMQEPLGLTEAEIDALVAFMQALEGEGYQDVSPTDFPQ